MNLFINRKDAKGAKVIVIVVERLRVRFSATFGLDRSKEPNILVVFASFASLR